MTDIYLHNTLSGKKELFTPITERNVGMYSCGPTVYSKPHIGNNRAMLFADLLRRVFEYNDYATEQVINITDIGEPNTDGEDKVEKAAQKEQTTPQAIAEKYTELFFHDLELLNIKKEHITFPKASNHIKEQIVLIQDLEEQGLTYTLDDGVYLDTSLVQNYGKLGNIDIEGLREGARLEQHAHKKNITDFVLWRFPQETNERHQSWDSPWGAGVPGWHLECSAMSQKYLGETFDIHTGGVDLIPTHHNNEIAQSESVTGKPLAHYWLHSNHLLVDGQKMSKSLGNTLFLEDLEEKNISPLAYRYWLLTADYKTLINFTWEAVTAAKTAFEKLIQTVSTLPTGGSPDQKYSDLLRTSVNDDLNTAQAIAFIWQLLKDSAVDPAAKRATIIDIDQVLGLNIDALASLATELTMHQEIPKDVITLAEERQQARSNKDWEASDRLRDAIAAKGFSIQDDGTEYHITAR